MRRAVTFLATVTIAVPGLSIAGGETHSPNQNETSMMVSKQALLGMQLSVLNQYKSGKASETQLKCVENLGYDKFTVIMNSILSSELTAAELKVADNFYGSRAGKHVQIYANVQTYKYAGIEPPEQISLSESEIREYALFSQTSAGQKLLYKQVTELPPSKKKIAERIAELLKSCNALPTSP